MESVTCAVCGNAIGLDEDHVDVKAEIVLTRDRNERDDYAVHPDCWRNVTEGWREPA